MTKFECNMNVLFRRAAENTKQRKHRRRKDTKSKKGEKAIATRFNLAQGSHQTVGQVGKRTGNLDKRKKNDAVSNKEDKQQGG